MIISIEDCVTVMMEEGKISDETRPLCGRCEKRSTIDCAAGARDVIFCDSARG